MDPEPTVSTVAAAPPAPDPATPPAMLASGTARFGATAAPHPNDRQQLVLLGNPNVGKSVLFGYFTGRYVNVSNYPGTTVEVARGRATSTLPGFAQVIDSPGINTLVPQSEDERVTRDILLAESGAVVLQVADAKNLRRALLISLQLAELEVPFALALNMMDEARSRGLKLELEPLEELLGVPVVPTVAVRKRGVGQLSRRLPAARRSPWRVRYEPAIESAVAAILELLPPALAGARAIALMLAAGDRTLLDWVQERLSPAAIERLNTIVRELRGRYAEPIAYVLNRQRLAQVDAVVGAIISARARPAPSLIGRLGNWAMHPVWGLGVLAVVLYAVYWFVGVLGAGTLVDLLEGRFFGELVNPLMTRVVDRLLPFAFAHDLLVGDYGVISMALTYGIAIVLPIVGTFFVAFSLLEDSGYLPRLAVMVNRVFRGMGLNGKAVLPMVLGLGCDTMATLTTRILDSRKERVIVTLLLALGVPCSAQLGVILGMLGRVGLAASLVWGVVVIAVLFLVGWLSARVLPGRGSDFILELPPIRVPSIGNILVKTLARIEWYLREAMPLFVIGTLVLFTLDRLRLLAVIERASAPLFSGLLGLPAASAGAFIIGFLRRDYGAAGLYAMERAGQLDGVQVVVALTTMTLFIPCIANIFMIIKERGWRSAIWMSAFIFPFALLVGAVLNWFLHVTGITFGGG